MGPFRSTRALDDGAAAWPSTAICRGLMSPSVLAPRPLARLGAVPGRRLGPGAVAGRRPVTGQ